MATDKIGMNRTVAAAVVSLPWLFFAYQLLAAPKGYLMDFIKLPLGVVVVLVSLVVSGISWWALHKTTNKIVWAVIILFLVLPQCLTPLFGPEVSVLIQGIRPSWR